MNTQEYKDWLDAINMCLQQPTYGSKRACALCLDAGSRPFELVKGNNPKCENCPVTAYTEEVEGYGDDGGLTPCETYMRDLVISGEIVPDIHADPPEDHWEAKFVRPRLVMLREWVKAKLGEVDNV